MLDPNLLRHNPAELAARLREARGYELDAGALEALESERKQIQVRTQELQNLRNTRSKAFAWPIALERVLRRFCSSCVRTWICLRSPSSDSSALASSS